MRNQIKINNPCPEKWDNMQDSSEGKFCEKCSKCVVDFTDKTNEQIQNVLSDSNGKEICGRISSRSLSKIATGIVLVTNLTFVRAQIYNNSKASEEQTAGEINKLSGKLIFKETQKVIPNAEVLFITRNKLTKTVTNENGYFSLDIPNNLIEDENVIYFNFDKLNEIRRTERKGQDTISSHDYGNKAIIFSDKEKFENRKFQIGYREFTIGEVVFMKDPPPNYYYFNGKSISEEKFEKLKKENPQYQYFSFEGKEAKAISKSGFIDTVYLLYSN